MKIGLARGMKLAVFSALAAMAMSVIVTIPLTVLAEPFSRTFSQNPIQGIFAFRTVQVLLEDTARMYFMFLLARFYGAYRTSFFLAAAISLIEIVSQGTSLADQVQTNPSSVFLFSMFILVTFILKLFVHFLLCRFEYFAIKNKSYLLLIVLILWHIINNSILVMISFVDLEFDELLLIATVIFSFMSVILFSITKIAVRHQNLRRLSRTSRITNQHSKDGN